MKPLLHILIFCGLTSLLPGQTALTVSPEPGIFFNTIGKAQGLRSGKVRHIMQDRRGFIYLCTSAGIERYDGYSLQHFSFPGNEKLSILLDQETRTCHEDSDGHFWIATDYNGLFEYDPASGKVSRYLHDRQPVLYIIDCILDKSGTAFWVATSDGVVRLGRQDKKETVFGKGEFTLTVFEDKEGVIWVGTRSEGIRAINPATGQVQSWLRKDENNHRSFPGYYCRTIAQAANGDLLFGMDAGYFSMNPDTKQVQVFFKNNSGAGFPCDNAVNLLPDSRGQLWAGSFGNGLALHDPENQRFFNYQNQPGMNGSLPGNYIEYLFEDAAGQIWVGDHSKGTGFFNGNTALSRTIRGKDVSALGAINAMLPDGETLWLGLPEGLAAYLPAKRQMQFFPLASTVFSAQKQITSLLRLPSGKLLAGTWHGLLQFDPRSRRFAAYRPAELPLQGQVLSLLPEGDSTFWVSTTDAKLWRVSLKNSMVRRFEEEGKLPRRAECNAMLQTRSGRLCFGSYAGFAEYDARLDSFVSNDVKGFVKDLSNAISDISEDENGTLWITRYGGGLDAFDPTTRRYRHFGTEDGLPDLACTSVRADQLGRVWVGTENGLAVFQPNKNQFNAAEPLRFRVLDVRDGLAGNEIAHSAFMPVSGRNGVRSLLFFATGGGLNELRPELLTWKNSPPKPVLTAFYLFDKLAMPAPGGILELPLEKTCRITLPPRQNFFTLEFSSLDFPFPAKSRYRYLLEGYDPAWVEAGARHSANYTNVPPGDYTFRLEAFNEAGIRSETTLDLEIIILPAWNQTWWFAALVGGAALLAVYGWFRWRLAQLRKLESMRQAIAADLHDEVGASLTSIQILSQLAAHPDPARRSEALEKLPEQVRRTAASLREIVWNIQPKHDALHLLLSQLTRYAGEVFEKSDIQYSVQTDDFPEGAALDPVTRQHFTRIFKEVLSNLVRHSRAGRAAVFFKKENRQLVMTVRDDGKGFDVANVRRGNGLDNMAQRAKAAGGSLDIRSSVGEGTEIRLELPLKLKKKWWGNNASYRTTS